jgi:copper chaperone
MIIQRTLKVEGMTCQHCVETVSETVTKMEGVEKVDVNLEQENVRVEYDESKTQLEDISVQIVNAGFEVVGS